jgi:hypothetical protein
VPFGGRLLAIVPTVDEIFNVVSRDANCAHAWRMNRAQLAGTFAHAALKDAPRRFAVPPPGRHP